MTTFRPLAVAAVSAVALCGTALASAPAARAADVSPAATVGFIKAVDSTHTVLTLSSHVTATKNGNDVTVTSGGESVHLPQEFTTAEGIKVRIFYTLVNSHEVVTTAVLADGFTPYGKIRCAAGIAGGALTGAVPGALVGSIPGAVIGAVGGALQGAADNC